MLRKRSGRLKKLKLEQYEIENRELDHDYPIAYYYLGITGEAGEVSEIFKKAVRSRGVNAELNMTEREQLIYELGDVLWYVTALGRKYGWTLGEIAIKNVDKLCEREEIRATGRRG